MSAARTVMTPRGLREFTDVNEMMTFYKQLRDRRVSSWIQPRRPPAPLPEPTVRIPLTPLQRILIAAAEEFDTPPHLVRSSSRSADVCLVRQVVCMLSSELTNMPASQIGKLLGHRDRTTVHHSIGRIQAKMRLDPLLADKVQRLRDKLLEQ